MHCEGISVEGPQGNLIQSTQEMILRFTSQVGVDAERWAKQLIDCPAELESIERNVHQAYAQGADLLVAGLIAMTIHDGKVLEAAEQTRRQYSRPLQKGRQRATRVRLLGGMIDLGFHPVRCTEEKAFWQRQRSPSRLGYHVGSVRIWQSNLAWLAIPGGSSNVTVHGLWP